MNNFMAIDIHTLTNRKKNYGRVGFISVLKKNFKMRSFSPSIWKNAPGALPEWFVISLNFYIPFLRLFILLGVGVGGHSENRIYIYT